MNFLNCGGNGHKSYDCPNYKVMVMNENRKCESMNEEECEDLQQVASTQKDDTDQVHDHKYCDIEQVHQL
jgi:hypothetical protein